MKTLGTTPPGTATEEQAARWVRSMFGRVAHRYDLLNHLLSFQVDRYWRFRTVREVRHVLSRPDARVMDLCCGTGDLLLALSEHKKAGIFGADFCHPMLIAAAEKARKRRSSAVLFEADALCLPVSDRSLDLVTVAFGFRNFANYRKGLEELKRVLRPGGMVAILEFSRPQNSLIASAYNFYSRWILPRLGGAISGSPDAYAYLPESVRKFPGAEDLAAEMRQAGYVRVRFKRMTFGVVALHLAEVD